LVGQVILGSEGFMKKTNPYLGAKEISKLQEVPREQRLSSVPVLDEIFQKETRKGNSRDKINYMSYYDFSQKEIAEYLNLHYTTISRIIKRYENRQKTLK
jgi:hypothetical protein